MRMHMHNISHMVNRNRYSDTRIRARTVSREVRALSRRWPFLQRTCMRSSIPTSISLLNAYDGDVANAVLKVETYQTYKRAALRFLDWVGAAFPSLCVSSDEQMDALLHIYINTLACNNGSRSLASLTLSSITHFIPRFRWSLPRSQRALAGWRKLSPSQSWPPIPYDIAMLLAFSFLITGDFDKAVITLLSFHCLLRINECLCLRVCDVAGANDIRFGSSARTSTRAHRRPHHTRVSTMSIHIPSTKTGSSMGDGH